MEGEREEGVCVTKTDAPAAVIIFQYSGRVRRPSSVILYPCFLTARNRKESRSRAPAMLHLPGQPVQARRRHNSVPPLVPVAAAG